LCHGVNRIGEYYFVTAIEQGSAIVTHDLALVALWWLSPQSVGVTMSPSAVVMQQLALIHALAGVGLGWALPCSSTIADSRPQEGESRRAVDQMSDELLRIRIF
jgi:hypothetical protein